MRLFFTWTSLSILTLARLRVLSFEPFPWLYTFEIQREEKS